MSDPRSKPKQKAATSGNRCPHCKQKVAPGGMEEHIQRQHGLHNNQRLAVAKAKAAS